VRSRIPASQKVAWLLPPQFVGLFKRAYDRERNGITRINLKTMIDEVRVAEEEGRPICQDTERVFYAVVLGGKTRVDGDLNRAFLQVAEKATEEVPLRPNSVHPLSRKNLEGKFLMGDSLPLPGSGSGNGLSGGDAHF